MLIITEQSLPEQSRYMLCIIESYDPRTHINAVADTVEQVMLAVDHYLGAGKRIHQDWPEPECPLCGMLAAQRQAAPSGY